MSKLDGLSIPMIMGDWRLIIQVLEEKKSNYSSIDFNLVSDDKAAEISEDIDKLNNILVYLKQEYQKEYGIPPCY